MRWLKFTAADKTSWGIVEGDQVIAVDGDPFGEWQRTSRTHPLSQVRIELPLIPRTFYCVGLNYLKHLKEAADKRGEVPAVPDRPEIGYRAQNALIAHDEEVMIPSFATDKIHYEGELVVVIGKKVKHLTKQKAMDCVFGYTIGNDVSERSWQKADRSLWRSKNADTFKPMGPWIETESRPRQDGNDRPGQQQGDQPLPHQRHDLWRGALPGRADQILYVMARRRDLDGNGWCVA
jgi:2-keto-4-pentenoate hydratase/2-oxohepta-3-ene-1,7-dioic acid hydratase in catechol pathway